MADLKNRSQKKDVYCKFKERVVKRKDRLDK